MPRLEHHEAPGARSGGILPLPLGPGEYSLKRLIVTGDDFGISLPVNEAIEQAHSNGILTATCLMVAGDQAADAVSRAKHLPRLGVGLHVVVTRGNPILPPGRIPALLDDKGRFDDNLVRAGFRYFFRPPARRQLAAEIRAQFDAFAKSGLALDHVNAHNHMHLHPTVLSLIIRIGREYGMTAIRLPYEPSFTLGGLLIRPWVALVKIRLRKAGIKYNDYVFGISSVGKMNKQTMLETIAALPDGVSEIFTHPATKAWPGMEPEASQYLFEEELRALTDPEMRDQVTRAGAELISFKSIPEKE